MSDRAVTRCDQCGKRDDHPKVHMGAVTKHHDCLSVDERQMLVDSAQVPGQPKASAIIEACEGGLRGEKLVQKILSGDLPEAEGIVQQRQMEEAADRAARYDRLIADAEATIAADADLYGDAKAQLDWATKQRAALGKAKAK